ncbi:unnamed protein product [Microthlaspi erraticum]|uniref:Factor of DNA methylation 1-5/IDN2 domain-containing protein n=1 Tax=Microthlaspi erraticum TaxID=1685480 RepID=A0A6D2JC19_9BRAS|nr:unnamed protein product [Microthlaspi erraticum]
MKRRVMLVVGSTNRRCAMTNISAKRSLPSLLICARRLHPACGRGIKWLSRAQLKYDYGERVCDEVVRAKEEIEDHNASGSYVIVELWNYEENRKATLEEATNVMLKVWSDLGDKKNKRQRL